MHSALLIYRHLRGRPRNVKCRGYHRCSSVGRIMISDFCRILWKTSQNICTFCVTHEITEYAKSCDYFSNQLHRLSWYNREHVPYMGMVHSTLFHTLLYMTMSEYLYQTWASALWVTTFSTPAVIVSMKCQHFTL